MNERIKELIKQHGINITIDGLGYGEGNVEGLAELIVRECARVDSEANNVDHVDGETYNQTILQHFGIKK
jgi:hypothetical protein